MTLEQAKAGFAFAGMLVAVAGVVLDNRIVVWVAIALLGVAVVLRVLIRRSRPSPTDEPEVE